MNKFISINEEYQNQWTEFVSAHKNGNFFQTYEYYSLFEKEQKNKAFAYALIENGNILGLIVGVLESNLFGPLEKYTRRAIVRGGPLVLNDEPDILNALMTNLVNEMEHRCIYLQIRNLFNTENFKNYFEELGFNYIPHLDILMDLTQSEEAIKKGINSNRRGNINKSINKGTIFKELIGNDEIKKGIDLIHETYKRVKLPVPKSFFFLNAFKLLNKKKLLRIFGAYVDNILIGVRFELCYKDTIYDWFAGSNLDYKNRYPNDYLPYQILIWGKNNGFRIFDFGGAGKPNVPYGVREHKMKFGGELVEYGRYQIINNGLVYNAGKNFFQLLKKTNDCKWHIIILMQTKSMVF